MSKSVKAISIADLMKSIDVSKVTPIVSQPLSIKPIVKEQSNGQIAPVIGTSPINNTNTNLSNGNSIPTKFTTVAIPHSVSSETGSPTNQASNQASKQQTINLSQDQKQALETLNDPANKFIVLTGAAGTGKTFVIKHWLYQYYQKHSYYYNDIALAAFTGKACRTMVDSFAPTESDTYDQRKFAEAITMNICTIHKLLGFKPEMVERMMPNGDIVTSRRFMPTYNKGCKLHIKILILDEISMLGLDLWNDLRMAIDWPRIEKILFIGDLYQLQPVIGKSIFTYLTQLSTKGAQSLVKVSSLETNHRQGEGNPILDFATKLRSGSQQEIAELMQPTKGKCYLMNIENLHLGKLLDTLLAKFGEEAFSNGDVTLITGGNKGDYGQKMLNHIITGKLSNRQPVLVNIFTEVKNFAIGDRVMFTKNDYSIGVINGTQGTIARIGKHSTGASALTAEQLGELILDEKDFSYNLPDSTKLGEDDNENFYDRMASHSVTVVYNDLYGEEREVTLDSIGEIKSLIHGYALTCYKAQGSTLKHVIVFNTLDATNTPLITNEFLYTATTRAKESCIILYNTAGAAKANRRELQGVTIAEKIAHLNRTLSLSDFGIQDIVLTDTVIEQPKLNEIEEDNKDEDTDN